MADPLSAGVFRLDERPLGMLQIGSFANSLDLDDSWTRAPSFVLVDWAAGLGCRCVFASGALTICETDGNAQFAVYWRVLGMTTIGKRFQHVNRLVTSGLSAFLCLPLFFAAGCSNQSGLAPAPLAVTVNITAPASTVMEAGSTISLTASASTGGVTWEAYGNNCYGTPVGCGTFSATTGNTVQYIAPATNPGTQIIEVRATSAANFTVFATLDLTVTPVTVTIAPPTATTLKPGTAVNLVSTTTTVNATGNTVTEPAGVTWSLSGAGCSGAACGALSNSTSTTVTYTAPAAASATGVSVTITATSVSDPGESASVTFTMLPAVIITITPTGSTTVPDGDSLGLSAATTNDPTNSGVTWITPLSCTVAGIASSGAVCGALSGITPTSVAYTAPKAPAGTVIVSLMATSNYTSNVSVTETLNVPAAPVITIATPSSTTVNDNTSLLLNATVANDINNAGISWTLTCTINGNPASGSACGALSGASNSATGAPTASSVTYNAPAAPPASIAVTITATSNANNLVIATQSLTVPAAPVITFVSPATKTNVAASTSQPVTASVTNDAAGKGVTFTLTCDIGNGAVTSGLACGTIIAPTNTAVTSTTTTSTFSYKAPTTALANPINVTVLATSNLLATSTNTLALVVPGTNAVTLSVTPPSATVADGATQSLTATVGNDSTNAGVTWSLSCLVGTSTTLTTGSTCGTINPTSSTTLPYSTLYTAPLYPQFALSVTVVATSKAATTVASSATLSAAAAPQLTIAVTPQPTSPNTVYYAQSGVPLTLTAVVSNDQATPGVTWTATAATGFSCPSSGCGTFSAPVTTASTTVTGQTTTTDIYTAPSGLAAPLTVVLTATSNSETNVASTLSVTAEPAITFSPALLGFADAQGPTYSQTVTVTGGTPPYTSIAATNLPTWATAKPNLTAGTITISGNPATAKVFSTSGAFIYATPTILTTGTNLIALSAVDSTPSQPLTGTASSPLTGYNPNSGTSQTEENSILTGSYVFYGTGFQDSTSTALGYPLRLGYIGSFKADGSGNITGEADLNTPTGFQNYTITGSYSVQANQVATITILLPTSPVTPITLRAALGGLNGSNIATTGQFIEYDDATGTSGNRVTGEISLQSPTVLSATTVPIIGQFAFEAQGGDPAALLSATCEAAGTQTCGPAAVAGAVKFTSAGAISGEEDVARGSVTYSTVGLAGSLDTVGSDANGRITGSMTASSATLTAAAWPSKYAIYAIDASDFYFMSTDSFTTTAMLAGKAQLQTSNIPATPLASTPLVLFGSAYGAYSVYTPSCGGDLDVLLLLTPNTSASTIGGSGAFNGNTGQITNCGTSGSYAKPTITGLSYSADATYGRVPVSGGTYSITNDLGNLVMYMVDTNKGFAVTQPTPSTTLYYPTGVLFFYPQTSTSLNAGTYTTSIFKNVLAQGVDQIGVMTMSTALSASSGSNTITGELVDSYNKIVEESNAGGGSLFDLELTASTLKNTAGSLTLATPNGVEACAGGLGLVISTTSFACIPSGPQVYQQVLYAVQ
jgi:hypothetical protein